MNSIFHVETIDKYSVTFDNIRYTYLSVFNPDNGDSLAEKLTRLDKKKIKQKEHGTVTEYVYNMM